MAELAARTAGMRLRMPMVDRELVECAAAVPTAMKQRGGVRMYALRAVLAHELPAGLMPPARRLPARHAWLRPALGSLVPAVLLGPRFDGRGIVSRPALRQLWSEHQTGRGNHTHRLWSLLMLELWFRDVIDGNPAEMPAEYAVLTSRHARVRESDATVKAA
jgi:asparagine synthase (glutamine-hydrolysing)